MGCAQAKQSHPNTHGHYTHETNKIQSYQTPQKRQVIKTESPQILNNRSEKQITNEYQNSKHSKQNSQSISKKESKKILGRSVQEKKSQTGLQQLLDDKTKEQKEISINVNSIEIDTNKTKAKIQGEMQEGEKIVKEQQNNKNSLHNHFKNSLEISNKIDISEDLKRNYRIVREQYIEEIRVGVQERVQDHKKQDVGKQSEMSEKDRLNHTADLVKKNSSQKRINQTSSKKPLTDNHLFYSQLKPVHNRGGKEQDDSQKQNRYTEQRKKTQQYNSYFAETIKDEKVAKSEAGKMNDRSLKQEKSPKAGGFNKKNQYYSVLENKKGFEDRFMSSNERENGQHQKGFQQKTDDFLIEEHDQQGEIRAPLETSYHAPSKRTIQSSSKKSLSSSNSRPTQKYLEQLPNSPITQRVEQQMENEFSDQAMSSQNHRQLNKFQTACFKESSKNALQISKENFITVDENMKLSNGSQKGDPILYSEISFRQREDSCDDVPEQGNYVQGLQMSVHLNMASHF